MTKPYSLGVYVARWQGHHRGEQQVLSQALDSCDQVLVVLGSAGHSRDLYHPFDEEQREALIRAAVHPSQESRLRFVGIEDRCDNARWNGAVLRAIYELEHSRNVAWFIGADDPAVRYYRESFDQLTLVEVDAQVTLPKDTFALACRYFGARDAGALEENLAEIVPLRALRLLQNWQATSSWWGALCLECREIRNYRAVYTEKRYLTADAVVLCSGHVLLIQRREGAIGGGLWAMPGGFVDAHEMFYAAALRELEEETGLHIPLQEAAKMLRGFQVAEHPLRSPRARLVTQAAFFDLGDRPLPCVQGNDDASQAHWVPIEELRALTVQLFEDHAAVLDHFLNIYDRP